MANRIAAILGQLFLVGVHRSIVTTSPVQLLLKPGGKEKARRRVFSDEELRIFVLEYRKGARTRVLGHMLKILLLTAARGGELCKARQADVDLEKREWFIPEDVAKNRMPRIIPLSDPAVAEFRALMELSGDSEYVLPRQGGCAPLPAKYLTRRVARCQRRFQKLGIARFRAHDLRRTCRTLLSRIGVDQVIAELVLNHKRPGIVGVYDLYEFVPQKRKALEKWAAYLENLKAEALARRIEQIKQTPPMLSGRCLSEDELRALVLGYRKATRTASLAHQIGILLFTAAEAQELTRTRWADVDLETGIWRVAENRTEGREAHLIPLTRTAILEFRALQRLTGHSDYVIPEGTRNAPVKPFYLLRRIARCQSRFQTIGVASLSAPDLQRTCHHGLLRSGVSQTDVDRLLKRMPAGIDPKYDLREALREKRVALERWETALNGLRNRSRQATSHPGAAAAEVAHRSGSPESPSHIAPAEADTAMPGTEQPESPGPLSP